MKFNLSDFLQLDTKGLLAVNGGYNCNGSTNNTVYPNTYYSGNGESTNGGGGNDHNGKNWYSKGDIVDSIPRGGTFIKSDGKSFTYSFGSGKSKNTTTFQKNPDGTYLVTYSHYDGPVSSNGSKNSGGSSGGGSCSTPSSSPDSSSRESNNPNGQGYSQTNPNPGKNSGDKGKKDNIPQGSGTCPGTDGEKTSSEKILEQIIAKGDPKDINKDQFDPGEKKGCYVKRKYQCDDYVEDILKSAGYKPEDYSIDNPSGKTVDKHIEDLIASKKTYQEDASKLTAGAYVVFMSDKEKELESHAALMFINTDGSAFLYDNSSHNFSYKDKDNKDAYYGGIEKTSGSSAKNLCTKFSGYENFYFQKI